MKEQEELMNRIRAVLGEPTMTHPSPTTVALSFPKMHYHPPSETAISEFRDFCFVATTITEAAKAMLQYASHIRKGDCCQNPLCANPVNHNQTERHQIALFL